MMYDGIWFFTTLRYMKLMHYKNCIQLRIKVCGSYQVKILIRSPRPIPPPRIRARWPYFGDPCYRIIEQLLPIFMFEWVGYNLHKLLALSRS